MCGIAQGVQYLLSKCKRTASIKAAVDDCVLSDRSGGSECSADPLPLTSRSLIVCQ